MRAQYQYKLNGFPIYVVVGELTRNLVSLSLSPIDPTQGTLHCSQCGYRCVPDEKPCAHMRAAISVATKGE